MAKTQSDLTAKRAKSSKWDAMASVPESKRRQGVYLTTPQQRYLEKAPFFAHLLLKRAFSGKSKAAAIKAKCYDCCCYQRNEVYKCTAADCPLWPYRPTSRRQDSRIEPVPAEDPAADDDDPVEQSEPDR